MAMAQFRAAAPIGESPVQSTRMTFSTPTSPCATYSRLRSNTAPWKTSHHFSTHRTKGNNYETTRQTAAGRGPLSPARPDNAITRVKASPTYQALRGRSTDDDFANFQAPGAVAAEHPGRFFKLSLIHI